MLLERHLRTLRFALVGVFCFGMQYVAALALVRLGLPWPIANATAFALSAQLNFGLSSTFTWVDRRIRGRRSMWRRWVSYNGTTLLSLAVNTAVFAGCYRLVGSLPAAAVGVAVGATATYLICNYMIFRPAPAPAPVSVPVPVPVPVSVSAPSASRMAAQPVRGQRPADSSEVAA